MVGAEWLNFFSKDNVSSNKEKEAVEWSEKSIYGLLLHENKLDKGQA